MWNIVEAVRLSEVPRELAEREVSSALPCSHTEWSVLPVSGTIDLELQGGHTVDEGTYN